MGKYLELFLGEVGDLTEKTKLENKPYVAYSTKLGKVVYTVVPEVQPDNEIWYTTLNGQILGPEPQSTPFPGDVKVVSNTYVNGKGIIKFDKPLTEIDREYRYDWNIQEERWMPRFMDMYVEGALYEAFISIILPDGITKINKDSIECYQLQKFKYPKNYNRITQIIGADEIVFPVDVEYILHDSFSEYIANLLKNNKDSQIIINKLLYCINGEIDTDLHITDKVKYINGTIFKECTNTRNISQITIPNTITKIESNAFTGIGISRDKFINNSSLDAEANDYCGIRFVDFVNGLKISNDSVIDYTNSIDWENVIIPESVQYIGGYVFENTPIKKVTIPTSVTSIGSRAFAYTQDFEVVYEGTKSQWNTISKTQENDDYDWACDANSESENSYKLTIHCTDGDINIDTFNV